jgi:hypothetical protein
MDNVKSGMNRLHFCLAFAIILFLKSVLFELASCFRVVYTDV